MVEMTGQRLKFELPATIVECRARIDGHLEVIARINLQLTARRAEHMQAVRDHDTSFNYQQYVEWRLRALAAKNYEEKKLRKLKKWLSDVNLIADQIKNRNGQIKIDPSNETCLLLALYCACRHLIRSTHSLGGTIDSEDQDVIDLVSNYFNSNPDLILSCAPK